MGTTIRTALNVLTQKELPGWGWWLDHGATSLWEDRGGTMSLNHVMFGDPGVWLWEFAGGICPQPGIDRAGFKCFTVESPSTQKLTCFSGQYRTVYGIIKWSWEKDTDGKFSGTLHVPEGCTVDFKYPDGKKEKLASGIHSLHWQ